MLLLIEGLDTEKYDFEEALDRSVIKYNAPGKESNKEIMDFWYYGKDNPNPERFNIQYLTNVKKYQETYFK